MVVLVLLALAALSWLGPLITTAARWSSVICCCGDDRDQPPQSQRLARAATRVPLAHGRAFGLARLVRLETAGRHNPDAAGATW